MIRNRLATADDVPQIAPLETAAAEVFRTIGMDAVADDTPIADSLLLNAVDEKRLWVAVEYGAVRAYLLGDFLPQSLHIDQVTVHPDAAHRGIGAMLIESVSSDSRARELGQLTLTSFENVPWNAPYYERIGFLDITESDWPAGVAEKIEGDQHSGFTTWPRVIMQRAIVEPALVKSETT